MQQKRYVAVIVFSVVLLLLIAGCKEKAPGPTTTPFLGGTKGLELGFLEGLPPDEVTDGGTFPFQVGIRLKNVGEFDLKKEEVNIDLIGIRAEDFDADASDLKGKNPEDDPLGRKKDAEGNIREPVETFVIFPNASGNFKFTGDIYANTLFIFRADVCYKYQTKVVSELCVLKSMIDVPDDAICDPSGAKAVFSSASPMQVNAFRQNVVGKDKIQFSFDIVHSGQGDVFEYDIASIEIVKPALDAVTAAVTAADDVLIKTEAAIGSFPTDSDYYSSVNGFVAAFKAVVSQASTAYNNFENKSDDATLGDAAVEAIINAADRAQRTAKAAQEAASAAVPENTALTNAVKTLVEKAQEAVNKAAIAGGVSCPKSTIYRRARENNVKVTIKTGLTGLNCVGLSTTGTSSSGTVKLVDEKRTVTCTQGLDPGRSDFKKPIDITMVFNYLDSTDKEVLVKHLVG